MSISVNYPTATDRVVLLEMIATTTRQVRILDREYERTHTKEVLIAVHGARRALDELLMELDELRLEWPASMPSSVLTNNGGNA